MFFQTFYASKKQPNLSKLLRTEGFYMDLYLINIMLKKYSKTFS